MSTTDEAETLQEIHKELKDYDEDVRELEEIKNQVDRFDLKQSKGARLLLRILIGKKHALKIYDQFALNASCFWRSAGSNIILDVQFHEIFVTKIMNKLFIIILASKIS